MNKTYSDQAIEHRALSLPTAIEKAAQELGQLPKSDQYTHMCTVARLLAVLFPDDAVGAARRADEIVQRMQIYRIINL